MYFTSGSDRAFEQLMQGKPGFDHYDSGEAVTPEDCGTCRFYRPHWKYQFCVYAECPYQPGKLTAYDAVTFRVKGVENMPVRMGGFPDGSFEKALAAGTKIPGHYHSDKGGIF